MGKMVERLAIRMFWKAEHLDPSNDGDVPESEWFGDAFPETLPARTREFWRLLVRDNITTLREPTEAMLDAMRGAAAYRLDLPEGVAGEREKYRRRWQAGIDLMLSE